MEPTGVVLFVSLLLVFVVLFALGLIGLVHPHARKHPGDFLSLLGVWLGGLFVTTFAAASFGLGPTAWSAWAVGFVSVLALDTHAVWHAAKGRKAIRTRKAGWPA